MSKIILASRSVGRKKLFEELFKSDAFEICVSEVDETSLKNLESDPVRLASALAKLKAEAVSEEYPDALVFGFDTVVICEGKLLGKPADRKEAVEMLRFLGGKEQRVISAWTAVYREKHFEKSGVETTDLFFHPMSLEEIMDYVSKYPVTRFAGAYGVQEKDDVLRIIRGRMDTVIGAPMNRIAEIVQEFFTNRVFKATESASS